MQSDIVTSVALRGEMLWTDLVWFEDVIVIITVHTVSLHVTSLCLANGSRMLHHMTAYFSCHVPRTHPVCSQADRSSKIAVDGLFNGQTTRQADVEQSEPVE